MFLELPVFNSAFLMAETLEETPNKRKTRVSSSDESPISNTSPETKKSRSGEHAVCFHEVSEQEAEEIYVIYRAGGPYGKKLCPRSVAKGTVFSHTDRPSPVNNIFFFWTSSF